MLTVFTLLPTHSPVSILPDPSQSSPYTPLYPSILLTCVQGLTGQKHQQKRWKTGEHPPQKPLGLSSQMPKYPPGLPSEARSSLQATLLIVTAITPSLCLHCDCLIWPSHHSVLNFSLSGIISHRQQRTSNVISRVFSESKW